MRNASEITKEEAHFREALILIGHALFKVAGSVETGKRKLCELLGIDARKLSRWHSDPSRVPLEKRRTLAILTEHLGRVTETEQLEAVGLQLRVLTARALAAHTVYIISRRPHLAREEAEAEAAKLVSVIEKHSAFATVPAVDPIELAAMQRRFLADDDVVFARFAKLLPPLSE
jgi:hypothetical protein